MSPDDETATTALSPDDAFSVLGNETRMEILYTLGEADDPLAFSALRERVGVRDSGQFNYHLDKLAGHFARKTDDGYELRQAGRWVVDAVLSGAVTEAPVLEPTPIDEPCPICDGQTVVAFRGERAKHYCTECAGHYGTRVVRVDTADGDDAGGSTANEADETTADEAADGTKEYGSLGSIRLPPAGLRGRTPDEVFRTGVTWSILEFLAMASRVCPRCSARLTESLHVCAAHDTVDGRCDECGNRHAVQVLFRCPNCLFEQGGAFVLALLADFEVLAFLVDHGINPVAPSARAEYNAAIMDYDEELRSVDPFEARFTFRIDGDELALTVDDDLGVVEVTRR